MMSLGPDGQNMDLPMMGGSSDDFKSMRIHSTANRGLSPLGRFTHLRCVAPSPVLRKCQRQVPRHPSTDKVLSGSPQLSDVQSFTQCGGFMRMSQIFRFSVALASVALFPVLAMADAAKPPGIVTSVIRSANIPTAGMPQGSEMWAPVDLAACGQED
jgi:hypothetical protein